MVIEQLPWKTSVGGAGGVPLAGPECDEFATKYLGRGVVCLSDGADAYEAFAGGELVCSPDCSRQDCLKRAQQQGKNKCAGARPRTGRSRWAAKYKHLRLSHGIATHAKEEWSIVKSITIHGPGGSSRVQKIKHGTEVADGCWQDVKDSYPSQVRSRDHDRIAEYVNAWAWRARRHGQDHFAELGKKAQKQVKDRCGGGDNGDGQGQAQQLAAGEPAPLAVNLGVDNHPAPRYTFAEASRIVKGLKLKGPLSPCIYKPNPAEDSRQPPPATKVADLPLNPYNNETGKRNTIVDIVEAPRDSFRILDVRGFMLQGMYLNLPGLLAPKGPVATPYKMELLIVDKDSDVNNVILVKHFKFDEKVPPEVFTAVCQGMVNIVDWGTNTKGGPMALAFMFDAIGGVQFRNWTFDNQLVEKSMSKEQIDKGIDFILAEAPRTNADLKQTRWLMHQLADPDSPIYSWSKGDVKECMSQIKDSSVTATKQTYLPICWMDLSPWFSAILLPLLPTLKRKSIIFLGQPGIGKSPAMQVLLMALSRYWICELGVVDHDAVPCFKTAEDLDFYRNDPGVVWCGCALDDGDSSAQLVRVLKSFLDVALREAITRERWGAAKFARNQPRMICDNKWDPEEEPKMIVNGERKPLTVGYKGTTHKEFLKMIRPAMPEKCCDSDIEAVCKRANIILNTDHYIYVRPAGLNNQVSIQRHKKAGDMYITEQAKQALERFTDHMEKPDEAQFKKMIEQEQAIIRKALADPDRPLKKVKMEEEQSFLDKAEELSKAMKDQVIDCEQEPVVVNAVPQAPAASTASSSIDGQLPDMETSPHTRRCQLFKKRTQELAESLDGEVVEIVDAVDLQPDHAGLDDESFGGFPGVGESGDDEFLGGFPGVGESGSQG